VSGRRAAGSLRKRGSTWFLRYYAEGRLVEESAQTGDERTARSLLVQRQREIAAGTWRAPVRRSDVLTVGAYLDTWVQRRADNGVRNARNERASFDLHVKPQVGQIPLAELTRVHVRELVGKLSGAASERTGASLAPRTVLHIYRALATACADAVLDGLIPVSPCTLRTRKGELPRKRDKDPKWRASAVYTRDEAETMIASLAIPADRRALYALQLLAGLRGSEATGRRWRDYDPEAVPLGRLTVATQADGADGERETKTGQIREVPVVPALAAILAEWKRDGFPLFFGRHAQPDDPIVPSRDDRDGRSFRSTSGAYERLVDDLETVGARRVPSARHAMRATFLTLLESDGANMGIARRATHAAPTDIVGGYVRTSWADLCREVGRLQLSPKPRATVHALPLASGEHGAEHGDLGRGARKGPETGPAHWAMQDLNLRLPPCEGGTLPLS
jgi:integrase